MKELNVSVIHENPRADVRNPEMEQISADFERGRFAKISICSG